MIIIIYGYHTTLFVGQQHPITVYRTWFLGVRCSGVQCYLCSFGQSLDEVLFHHVNYTTMYYIIWNEIFSFFPDRFEMYISVAWFWNLYIIMWKCVWCDTVRRLAAPHHILYDWQLLFGVRSCALGVNLCSFYQFFDKVLFHHDNYIYQVYGYDTTLFIGYQHPITVYRTGFWVCVVLVLNVIWVNLANPLMKLYFIMSIILLCIVSYETKFFHSFLIGCLRCIFKLPDSGICILWFEMGMMWYCT